MGKTPRFMIAAPNSGAGKTTITLALLSALQKRGSAPIAFRCGSDCIDPLFQSAVLDLPCHNLELLSADEKTMQSLLSVHGSGNDVAVIDGVTGYYDGISCGTGVSGYELAKATETPVILVVCAKGASLSIAAVINGFNKFREPSMIAGVILNDCSEARYRILKAVIEIETGLKLLGYFPRLKNCIQSRDLSLSTAAEINDLKQKLEILGAQAQQSIDTETLLHIAHAPV